VKVNQYLTASRGYPRVSESANRRRWVKHVRRSSCWSFPQLSWPEVLVEVEVIAAKA
jgi:hypothetical protein